MSEFSDARFFFTSVEIILPETRFSADSLVSPFGICRLVLPIGFKNVAARAQAVFQDFSADILLVKQYTENGAFYSARFDSLSHEQVSYLRNRVKREGVPPLWKRRFPRISVAILDENTNPHPSFCLFPWQGKDHKMKVVNFTIDGLRLHYAGELPGLRVGSAATISVYTSAGTGISGLEAEVKNFSLIDNNGQLAMEIGLRFTDNRSAAKDCYRSLIRDCVISLSKRNP